MGEVEGTCGGGPDGGRSVGEGEDPAAPRGPTLSPEQEAQAGRTVGELAEHLRANLPEGVGFHLVLTSFPVAGSMFNAGNMPWPESSEALRYAANDIESRATPEWDEEVWRGVVDAAGALAEDLVAVAAGRGAPVHVNLLGFLMGAMSLLNHLGERPLSRSMGVFLDQATNLVRNAGALEQARAVFRHLAPDGDVEKFIRDRTPEELALILAPRLGIAVPPGAVACAGGSGKEGEHAREGEGGPGGDGGGGGAAAPGGPPAAEA